MPAIVSKVLSAKSVRRWPRNTPKARADPNSRSTVTAPGEQGQFSQIEALIDSQNRTELAKFGKGELVRYLQQIAPFEEDFDVEKDELVDVLLLSGNAGGADEESALNDFDLSFLDEGLAPDDDVFKFTDDNGQFDKGPMPVNEAPQAPGAMNALVRERNLDPSYAEDSAADAMDWHSEDTGERDSGAYLDAQSSDSEVDSWQDDDLDIDRLLDAEGLGSDDPVDTSRGSRSFRNRQAQRQGLEAVLPPQSAGYASAREKLLGGGGGVARDSLGDTPVGEVQYMGLPAVQSKQATSGPGGRAGDGSDLEVQVEMEQDDWGDASSADDEEVLYNVDYEEDREIQDVLDDLSMNNADGRDVLDVINDEVIEDEGEEFTDSDLDDDHAGMPRSPGAGGVSSLMGSRPRLPWQQQRGGEGGLTGGVFGDDEEEEGVQQRQRARVGYLRGDIEGPESWFDEGGVPEGGIGAVGDELTEEQAAQLMEAMGLTDDDDIDADDAQRRQLQASLAENVAAVAPDPISGADPAVLGVDRTWGGAEAAVRRPSGSPRQGSDAGPEVATGWTWAGIGALQSWDEAEMAQEIDELKRELMSGQAGGLRGWEAAVESSLQTDSEGEDGAVSGGESGDRGSRRETAARLHPRAVSAVRQSASVAAAAPPQVVAPRSDIDTDASAKKSAGSGVNFFKTQEAKSAEAATRSARSAEESSGLQVSEDVDADTVVEEEAASPKRGRRKAGGAAAPDQSTGGGDTPAATSSPAGAAAAPKKRARKPSARKPKTKAAPAAGTAPEAVASDTETVAEVTNVAQDVTESDAGKEGAGVNAETELAATPPVATAASEVPSPARKLKRGRPKKQQPASATPASPEVTPVASDEPVASQPVAAEVATSSKSVTPVATEASAAAPASQTSAEARKGAGSGPAVDSMPFIQAATSPTPAEEVTAAEAMDTKAAPQVDSSADNTSVTRQLATEPSASETSEGKETGATPGRKKRPMRRLSDAESLPASAAPEAARTSNARTERGAQDSEAGSAATREQRQQKALELQAGVEVRKQQLLWLEGEVERMRVHAVAAEQRQKLLVEMQDLRAQLEGWSGAPAVQAQLGELRDPTLFPPPDPSAQQRAEVTLEILQDEVDGLRQQLLAREDAAAALQRDINAEFDDAPGTLLSDPTGSDGPSAGGVSPAGESGSISGGSTLPQGVGFDSEDIAAQVPPQSLVSKWGSLNVGEDKSTRDATDPDEGTRGNTQSSDSVRDALSRTFQSSSGGNAGSKGDSAQSASSGARGAQDSPLSDGRGAASSGGSDGGEGAASVGGGLKSGGTEPGRQAAGNEGSGDVPPSETASASDASTDNRGPRKDGQPTPMPKVGQLVNWFVNTVLPRPWK